VSRRRAQIAAEKQRSSDKEREKEALGGDHEAESAPTGTVTGGKIKNKAGDVETWFRELVNKRYVCFYVFVCLCVCVMYVCVCVCVMYVCVCVCVMYMRTGFFCVFGARTCIHMFRELVNKRCVCVCVCAFVCLCV
jgi:hypothetical protein